MPAALCKRWKVASRLTYIRLLFLGRHVLGGDAIFDFSVYIHREEKLKRTLASGISSRTSAACCAEQSQVTAAC